jgi:hypothetical protein
MNEFDHQWQKLTALARQAGDPRDLAAPYGFATRVAAQAIALPPASPWAAFERFALRGLLVAAACGVAAIAFNYSIITSEQADDYAGTDPVAEILNLS